MDERDILWARDFQSQDFVYLLISHGCLFWAIAAVSLPLAHDTMINFQMFATIYAEFLRTGEFPFWLPFTSQGITADFAYAFTFTPAFYLAAFLGQVFSVADTLLLFRFGLYVEEVLLLYHTARYLRVDGLEHTVYTLILMALGGFFIHRFLSRSHSVHSP